MTTPNKTPAPAVFVTKDLANHFDTSPKTIRRALRSIGIRCGSGARHQWTKRDYNSVVKRLGNKLQKPADSDKS